MAKKGKMIKERFKIAGGNTTLFVQNCPVDRRVGMAQKAIADEIAEQVGFISLDGGMPSLEMMGGELSINATLAFAYKLGGSGILNTSGLKKEVSFRNLMGETEITFELDYERQGDLVLFEGIGYLCTKREPGVIESTLWRLAKENSKPAFGLALYNDSEFLPSLKPIVYVDKIQSCVLETACGSGSIALNIVTGANKIVQQTGEIISVYKYKGGFTVSAEVVKIGKKR